MQNGDNPLLHAPGPSTASEIDAFLQKVQQTPVPYDRSQVGRLLFAMDATASREGTWDHAAQIQSEMFEAADEVGGLAVKLAFFRGYKEFKASRWHARAAELIHLMGKVSCAPGHTQLERVIKLAVSEHAKNGISALVYVGDCFEEDADAVCGKAGQLAMTGVPAFIFHEGGDPRAAEVFRHICKITGGAYCAFDMGAADQLKKLLKAVAVYAAGGRKALEALSKKEGGAVLRLTRQLQGG